MMKAMSRKLLAFIVALVVVSKASELSEAEEESSLVGFDYKCLLCKWSAQMIITYHAHKNANPEALFHYLSILCSYLGNEDKVTQKV